MSIDFATTTTAPTPETSGVDEPLSAMLAELERGRAEMDAMLATGTPANDPAVLWTLVGSLIQQQNFQAVVIRGLLGLVVQQGRDNLTTMKALHDHVAGPQAPPGPSGRDPVTLPPGWGIVRPDDDRGPA